MTEEQVYQIALTMIPDLGAVRCRILAEHFEDAISILKAKKKELSAIEGIGEHCAKKLKTWDGFSLAEEEVYYTEKHQIKIQYIRDKDFPQRLLHCYDPPTVLYFRGNANLNHPRIISMIGTRNHTEYGRQVTEQLIHSLQSEDVMIVSGLAFGIDAIAHRSSLQHQLPTIGVLGHGMDTIYPYHHRSLAKEMTVNGGILTEFSRDTKPDKHNFPKRNRIVAGMADATIVIETALKGGSMITAELAYNYNRDLFAIPGRIHDPKSQGCMELIKMNKATILTSAEQLMEVLGWRAMKQERKLQKELFIELSSEERVIVEMLKEAETLPVDLLHIKSGLSSSAVAAAILNLELQNVIQSLPGKIYKLI